MKLWVRWSEALDGRKMYKYAEIGLKWANTTHKYRFIAYIFCSLK